MYRLLLSILDLRMYECDINNYAPLLLLEAKRAMPKG